ncbi:MAG: Stp1/IreP family PP2C-type Ser/Thr phosphatase [Victivallaceae bacterium]|nr:Stp1/IreP family PP2C-type Ser/Thr phosphatase [Victivallaceae bacterium]
MDKLKIKNQAYIPRLTFSGETHIGLIRDVNEDCFCYIDYHEEINSMAVIADGIGGHKNGEVASSLCCRQFVASWKYLNIGNITSLQKIKSFLQHEIRSVNKDIFSQNKRKNFSCPMGTTVVAAVFTPTHVVVGHAGDSRLYVLNEDKLKQLTEDHSLVATLVRKGTITSEEAKTHPFAHIISKSIGPNPNVDPMISVYPKLVGERYLLCSDGLSMHVANQRIKEILARSTTPKNAVNALMKEALINGGEDNITIICAF